LFWGQAVALPAEGAALEVEERDQGFLLAGLGGRVVPSVELHARNLSAGADKYDELRKIQKAARILQAQHKLPPTWVYDRSQEACRRILSTPAPTNTVGGWPQ
jgi:hypothetical protein